VAKPRKTERLDSVLMRLGYATQPQIQEAVRRQSARGGRVGKNLVELGAITEDQLFDALVEQFRLPTTRLEEGSISRDLLERMPEGVVLDHLMLPLAWDADKATLSLVVANPSDEQTIEAVKDAFGARAVRLSLAQENVLTELAARLTAGTVPPRRDVRMIHLPELFGSGEATPAEGAAPGERERVLMVTGGSARKNFLPPIFEREGRRLVVANSAEEVVEALAEGPVTRFLVSEDMRETVARWRADGRIQDPQVELTEFSAVSTALLDNPFTYGSVVQSLRRAVQALAQLRCAEQGVGPPYGLMTNDVAALARTLRVRTVVVDAISLGLHLLMPAAVDGDGAKVSEPFLAFPSSAELAAQLRFPWDLGALLTTCARLYQQGLKGVGDVGEELSLAAQILALVWFRHTLGPPGDTGTEDEVIAKRTALRDQAGRLATLDLIEEYLQLIAERGAPSADPSERRVLLVGADRISRALIPALERVASEAETVADLAVAQTTVEQEPPAAIVVDHRTFGSEVAKFARVMKLGGGSLLFVLTDSADQALVLNLLDIGVDDVFGPPHDFDLVAARISRAIRSRSRQAPAEEAAPGQFSATFEHFSFLDLAQMLSHGHKTVRVDLSKSDGEGAVLFMQKGRIVHATCGKLSGAHAVYRVIAWQDDGEFTVREETDFPAPTIEKSTESLLMEGCRLLDEGGR
jgi:DNA-binding response OmpR family regulator